MRLLITGGFGFIGSHVTAAALAAGHEVRVLDRRTLAEVDGSAPILATAAQADALHSDVTDADAVGRAMVGVDAVVHLAARVGLGDGVRDAAAYAADNALGTAVLLAAMASADVSKLVLSSSMVVYGAGTATCPRHGVVLVPDRSAATLAAGIFEPGCPRCGAELAPTLVDEDTVLRPMNVYAATKVSQEHLASSWARATGGVATMLRYHNVYGPGLPRDTPYAGVAAIFLSSLRRGEAPQVYEDGGQRRDFVHVRDVAAANLAALDVDLSGSHAYNIGSGEPRTIGDVAVALAAALDGPRPVVTGGYRLGDVRHITASSARAERELHWTATEDFATGMAELAHVTNT